MEAECYEDARPRSGCGVDTVTEPCKNLVMIVEDDRDVRDTIVEVLQDHGYRTLSGHNGAHGLEILHAATERPCVILLDIMMPVMDGRQFRASQREDSELAGIPVILLTAHGDVRRATDELGVDATLTKPVRLDTLLATVERFCQPAQD
jgi:CheY-like chemotaxis protein